jgi:hypothetical protein
MLDANAVAGYHLEVASGSHFFVVEQHSFGMQGLAVARVLAACSQDAYSGSAVACWHGLAGVGGVAGLALRGTRRDLHRRRSRRYLQVLGRSNKPVMHVLADVSGLR